MSVETELIGLENLQEFFRSTPGIFKKAARLAINQVVTRGGMKAISNEMYDQIAFPRGYLKGDRLRVSQYAKESNLEAVIIARHRPTSLARFAAPGTPMGTIPGVNSSVKVSVKNGSSTRLRNAWLIRLRRGASLTKDQYNVGLIMRVKEGDRIGGKHDMHQAWFNPEQTLALLYGPSVDQVFKDVAGDQSRPILDMLATEFFRQYERLS